MMGKKIIDEFTLAQIRPGETTKGTVRLLIGTPAKTTLTGDGGEIWEYVCSKINPKNPLFVPIARLFARSPKFQTYTLTIFFSKDGVVKGIGEATINNDD